MRAKFAVLIPMAAAMACGHVEEEEVYTGLVEGTAVRVPSLTGGRIVRLPAEEGRTVTRGDTLAVVDTTDVVLEIREVEASWQELTARTAAARTAVARARTDLSYLEEKQARTRTLHGRDAATGQAVDDLRNLVAQARYAVATALEQVSVLDAQGDQIDARLAVLRKKVADAVATSPIDGVVAARYYEAGEAVAPMQPVAEVIDLQEPEVSIFVAATRLPSLKQGQEVTVRVDGLDGVLPGRVARIADRAEFTPKWVLTPETRASLVYEVTVKVPNAGKVLKQGMPVVVSL